jgi:hypothetical protein
MPNSELTSATSVTSLQFSTSGCVYFSQKTGDVAELARLKTKSVGKLNSATPDGVYLDGLGGATAIIHSAALIQCRVD